MKHISEILAELAKDPKIGDAVSLGLEESPPEPLEAPESDDEGLPLGWEGVEVVK